jgi:hypothetical protein
MADGAVDTDPFEEGRRYPSTVENWPDADGPWQVTFDWKVIDGRIECVAVSVAARGEDMPVTPGVLRDLRLGERIRKGRAQITQDAAAGTPAYRVAGLRRSTRERLEEVARVYREAFAANQPPAKAVEERLGLTQGRASSLIARAREVGMLPPTSRGAPQG